MLVYLLSAVKYETRLFILLLVRKS